MLKEPLLHLDPEFAHRVGIFGLERLNKLGLLRLVSAEKNISELEVGGLKFLNPIGLAAGFDKNATHLNLWQNLGFGFCEVGTVTPKPQGGNPKPRLFRQRADQTLFNCMGFNNDGAHEMALKIEKQKDTLDSHFQVGINVGKQKETPLEEAYLDYLKCVEVLCLHGDFFVINVSSPNTPGLRSLQNVDSLSRIVFELRNLLNKRTKDKMLWVKLAPELTASDLEELLPALEKNGASAFVGTNTLGGTFSGKQGGFSGAVLTQKSRDFLINAKKFTSKPIISVGGIMTSEEAKTRKALGASLIELYTGWVYSGPKLIKDCATAFSLPLRKKA